nr:hypothetical protein [Tanacetum cinerariifolium]
KFIRSLSPKWNTHTIVWRNKREINTLSLDDLFNNLKIYEPEVKGTSSSNTNTQNVAFVSSNSTSNTNGGVNTSHGAIIASTQATAVNSTTIDNLSDAVIRSFFACQPNSLQFDNEDLQQIHPDDLEEMDLRWQMAMLTMKARRFLKNTERKFSLNGNETIRFDKSKAECYNFHKRGHFPRECRALRSQDTKHKESTRRIVPVETPTLAALVSCDRLGGYDCSDQAEDGPTNFALIAYSSTSSNSKVSTYLNCLSSCLENTKILREQYEQLLKDLGNLRTSKINDITYKTALESVEARLLVYKKNKSVYEEDIKLLKRLGYNVVPPPYTENFLPPKLDFSGLEEFVNELIVTEPTVMKPISDSEDEAESKPKIEKKIVKPSFAKIKFVKSKEQVKSPRKTTVKHVEKPRQNIHRPRADGKKVLISKSTIRRDLQLEDAEGVDCLPNAIIFEQLTLMRKPRRKVTEVPQPSDPTSVADEAVNEDIGNISKIQSKATPNEPGSQGTSSGGGPKCQETMGDTVAQTRSERVSKISNDPLLAGVNTPRCDEDSLKLTELTKLCTKLQQRVLDLKTTKTTQAMEIKSLKRRVNKLERRKRSRTHRLKRLYKAGLSARVESSKDEGLGEEDASKQGRIANIDANEDITLVSTHDEQMFDVDQDLDVTTAATTLTISIDEATLAQALAELKHAKSQDKGKAKMIEEPVKLKKKDQIQLDKEVALKRKFFDAKRAEEKWNKPPTQAQRRKIMCTYLKNIEGKNLTDLKNKSFDSIQKMFDKAFKKVNTFVDFRTGLVEKSSKKAKAEVIEGSSKRVREELEQENAKKQKIDDNKDTTELKNHMLKDFDREDLKTLWKLVKAEYRSTRPEGDYERVLWHDLKVMFKPHIEDEVWKMQERYNVVRWTLFNSCGVHYLSLQSGISISQESMKYLEASSGGLMKLLMKKLDILNKNIKFRGGLLGLKTFMKLLLLRLPVLAGAAGGLGSIGAMGASFVPHIIIIDGAYTTRSSGQTSLFASS